MIYAWFIAFKALPKWLHILLSAVTGILLFLGAKALYDANVIDRYQERQYRDSVEAMDKAAYQRTRDELEADEREGDREAAISGADNTGATMPASTKAFNCQRLREAFTPSALNKMPEYQEACK